MMKPHLQYLLLQRNQRALLFPRENKKTRKSESEGMLSSEEVAFEGLDETQMEWTTSAEYIKVGDAKEGMDKRRKEARRERRKEGRKGGRKEGRGKRLGDQGHRIGVGTAIE